MVEGGGWGVEGGRVEGVRCGGLECGVKLAAFGRRLPQCASVPAHVRTPRTPAHLSQQFFQNRGRDSPCLEIGMLLVSAFLVFCSPYTPN